MSNSLSLAVFTIQFSAFTPFIVRKLIVQEWLGRGQFDGTYVGVVCLVVALIIAFKILSSNPSDSKVALTPSDAFDIHTQFRQQVRSADGGLTGAGVVQLAGYRSVDDVMSRLSPRWTFRPSFLDASPEDVARMKSAKPRIPHIIHQVIEYLEYLVLFQVRIDFTP